MGQIAEEMENNEITENNDSKEKVEQGDIQVKHNY